MVLSHSSAEKQKNIVRSRNEKVASQQEISLLFSNINPQGYVHVASLLEEKGYSKTISHMPLHANWSEKTTVDFSGCQFESVKFTGNFVNTLFSGDFSNCLFSNASIDHCLFKNSKLDHSAFVNTSFYKVLIDNTAVTQCWFLNDNIEHTAFNNNVFQHTIFSENTMKNIWSMGNSANKVGLVNTEFDFDLTSSVYVEEVEPTVGIVGQSQWHISAEKALNFYDVDTLTINPYQLPRNLESNLNRDVKKAIKDYYRTNHHLEDSIPQFILNSNYPSIKSLNQITKEYVDQVDAVWIPGVIFDIHPEFYGKSKIDLTKVADSYTREMLEFSLIQEALHQNKPIIGVCHGSQMINIYFGGDLYQNVSGQFAKQNLKIVTPTGMIGEAIEEGIIGKSEHHQAIHHVGKGLEVVATYDDVVKACQAIDGSPIFLTQFHPEYLTDNANKQIVINFIEAATKWQSYTTALELADVLKVDLPFMEILDLKYEDGGFKFVNEEKATWPGESSFSLEQKSTLLGVEFPQLLDHFI